MPEMLPQAIYIVLMSIPRNICRMIVPEEYRALLRRTLDPPAAPSPRLDATGVDAPAPGVGSRISGLTQQLPQRLALRRMPLQLSSYTPDAGRNGSWM